MGGGVLPWYGSAPGSLCWPRHGLEGGKVGGMREGEREGWGREGGRKGGREGTLGKGGGRDLL